MPVPVSVTGWHDPAGGVSGTSTVAETGSFASLAGKGASSANRAGSDDPAGLDKVVAPLKLEELPPVPLMEDGRPWGVAVNELDFSYPGIDGSPIKGVEPLIKGMDLKLAPGSCCLLLGANGAGKTTLLKILGGKHLVPKGKVLILGREAFFDTSLTSSGELSYIGGNWQRDVAFAGYNVPLAGDFPASRMLDSIHGVDPARKKKIIEVLDIDVNWRMHQVSDGQRRRVQLAWGLMQPYKVLLLDEITVDLDVLGRADLMAFLRQECKEREVTIVYATHIFDGLEDFATHIAFVAGGKLRFCKGMDEIPELKDREPGTLLSTVEVWLRKEAKLAAEAREKNGGKDVQQKAKDFEVSRNNGWGAGRTTATITFGPDLGQIAKHVGMKNSSNAVMRG